MNTKHQDASEQHADKSNNAPKEFKTLSLHEYLLNEGKGRRSSTETLFRNVFADWKREKSSVKQQELFLKLMLLASQFSRSQVERLVRSMTNNT